MNRIESLEWDLKHGRDRVERLMETVRELKK